MANSMIIVFLFAILVPSAILAASVSEEHNIQKRSLGTCDFLQEAGVRCTGCHEVQLCLPFNIALNMTCDHPRPYCRNGHCSRFGGSLCSDTTTASTTTTSTTTTAATTTAATTTDATTTAATTTDATTTDATTTAATTTTATTTTTPTPET